MKKKKLRYILRDLSTGGDNQSGDGVQEVLRCVEKVRRAFHDLRLVGLARVCSSNHILQAAGHFTLKATHAISTSLRNLRTPGHTAYHVPN